MKRTHLHWSVIILIAGPGLGRADIDIPAIGQPSPFYGAAGKGVCLETKADPTEVGPDEFLVFTLHISKLDNPADVRRPDLTEIDAFRDFEVADDATTDPDPPGTRTFRYRLRPRRANITAIPAFVFPYFDPTLERPPDRPDFPFRKARAEPIPIRIRKAEAPPARIIPVDVPAFALSPAVESSLKVPSWVWWLAAIAPPLLAVASCVVWQIMNPVGARLARRRRSRAARSALKMLHSLARHAPDDSAAVVACVAAFLAERHDLPGLFRTPGELSERLHEAGADSATIAECTAFLREADAARFAPSPHISGVDLIADAERLIRRQEGEA